MKVDCEARQSEKFNDLKVTVIIAWDFIPGYSSSADLREFFHSLKYITESTTNLKFEYLLALDLLHPRYKRHSFKREYSLFRENLKRSFSGLKISTPTYWGHLVNNLDVAMTQVTTEYILVCQADLPFVADISIEKLIPVLNQVSYVLFNKFNNPVALGDVAKDRVVMGDVVLLRTDVWSDNNHLCKTKYYQSVILPVSRGTNSFPERAMMAFKSRTQEDLGTYIYGELGAKNTIEHKGEAKRIFLYLEKYLGNYCTRIIFRISGQRGLKFIETVVKRIWLSYAILKKVQIG